MRWDRPTSLIHLRTCITGVLVLLYAVFGLRDGFGLYTEHCLGVDSGQSINGRQMHLGVLRRPVQRL